MDNDTSKLIYEDPLEGPKEEGLVIADKIRTLIVVDQATLDIAISYRNKIKELRTWANNEFDKGIKEAWDHHKTLVAQKKKYTDKLDEADRVNNPKIATYLTEQNRIRFEAERAAQRAKEAIEQEATKAADKALEAIENGDTKKADRITEKATEKIEQIQQAAPVIPEKPIAEGTTLRENWEFEIVDANLIPRKFLIPDMTMIRRYGQNMKQQAVIPGVRFYTTKTVISKPNKGQLFS